MRTLPNDEILSGARLPAQTDFSQMRSVMLERAALLPMPDRHIVKCWLGDGMSTRQIARCTGYHPGSISRTLKQALQLLSSNLVVWLLSADCPLPERLRKLAIDYHVRQLSYSRLSTIHHMGRGSLAVQLAEVDGYFQACMKQGLHRGEHPQEQQSHVEPENGGK